MARSGCQWSKKRSTKRGVSRITNWWMAPLGKRCSARLAEVTVPDVHSTAKSFSQIRSMSGITASSSPTLAPWTHTSGPGGRATVLSP
jgi:hypothetical protein